MAQHQDTETGTCLSCGRPLRTTASIARRRGPKCARKVRAVAKVIDLTAFKDAKAARAKAIELIEDGAIVPTRHAGQYLATSGDGTTVYLVDLVEGSCTCKGHQRVGRCYHGSAAAILSAAARKAA